MSQRISRWGHLHVSIFKLVCIFSTPRNKQHGCFMLKHTHTVCPPCLCLCVQYISVLVPKWSACLCSHLFFSAVVFFCPCVGPTSRHSPWGLIDESLSSTNERLISHRNRADWKWWIMNWRLDNTGFTSLHASFYTSKHAAMKKVSLVTEKRHLPPSSGPMPLAVCVCCLCENGSNIKLAAGVIAASWQSSQAQSVVDGGEYREEKNQWEREKGGMKCNTTSALILLQLWSVAALSLSSLLCRSASIFRFLSLCVVSLVFALPCSLWLDVGYLC